MAITDEQITAVFTANPGLGDHNGRFCGKVLYNDKGQMTGACGGGCVVKDGKVKLAGHCGYVCHFLDNVQKFSGEVDRVIAYDAIITKAKRAK